MEFLVHIEIRWPADGDAEQLERVTAAERRRAAELTKDGLIQRLWRVPGRRANYGLWSAADADALHGALSSLPMFPWLDIEVIPLATHPSDPGPADDSR
ncbi:muconolactone Delta-isomerase family protein [soil metagenome]